MKYNKGFAPVLIIVVGILAIGGISYFIGKSKAPSAPVVDNGDYTSTIVEDTSATINNNSSLVNEQSPKQKLTSCFVSPKAGDKWTIGSKKTITLKNLPLQSSHCSNGFSLVKVDSNTTKYVGKITDSEKGVTLYPITVPNELSEISCGTGAYDDPAYVSTIISGQYKIVFSEDNTNTIDGSEERTSCESDIFTIE